MPVLINVAFITLLERKVLGYSQLRKGPNKVGVGGLIQPFNDAIKLFSKELVLPRAGNLPVFLIGPRIAIGLALLVWFALPLFGRVSSVSLGIIFIYAVLRINVYPLMASGWASNSRYSIIGALRGIAQTISYEVRFALAIIFFLVRSERLGFQGLMECNQYWTKVILFFPLFILWVIICVAETNRTPFDFAEGESELVSGFNVEYGRVGFAVIFIAEYARIYFMSSQIVLVFFLSSLNVVLYFLLRTSLVFVWIWVRTTLPRYRYDLLINLAWTRYLPIVLFLMMFVIGRLK